MPETRRALDTYLNDHLAGAAAGTNLARTIATANVGGPREAPTRDLAAQVEEDRRRLIEITHKLGISRSAIKQVLGALSESISRVKLSPIGSRSPGLVQVLRFETLIAGVTAKRRLWRALQNLHLDAPLDTEIDQLLHRAEEQLEVLERLHEEASREVFVAPAPTRRPATDGRAGHTTRSAGPSE